jgi:guanine deaminase
MAERNRLAAEIVSDEIHLQRAIECGRVGMELGHGGPFGALIVLDGVVLAEAHNEVLRHRDPTAHAEIQCIRAACAQRGDFSLAGATIFSSCEPCPMCLSAIHWARIGRLVFGASRDDAAEIGFDDALLYDQIARPIGDRDLPTTQILRAAAREMMAPWTLFDGRIEY